MQRLDAPMRRTIREGDLMRATKRAAAWWRGSCCGRSVVHVGAGGLAADDGDELVDTTKTVTELERKLDELHARGRAADGANSPPRRLPRRRSRRRVLGMGRRCVVSSGSRRRPRGSGHLVVEQARGARGELAVLGGRIVALPPEKGEAISPAMCVTQAHPTIRMFAANTGNRMPSWRSRSSTRTGREAEEAEGRRARGDAGWRRRASFHVRELLGAAFEDGVTAIA